MESTEAWFEDAGSAMLVNGSVTVPLEKVYAQTINTGDYHVFLTPLGDCPLYVAAKTATGFTVKALGGAKCNISFEYRIMGKRLGYETKRLEAAQNPA